MDSAQSIFRQAFALHGKSQSSFGALIGKNQSQVSKYLNGQLAPPADSIIQCMNMIHKTGLVADQCPATLSLVLKIKKLKGPEYAPLRRALEAMIDAVMESPH